MECLEEFNQYYDDRLFNKHVMEEIRRQFMEKYMIIGVVGRHKAGKSTLLNGLLHAEWVIGVVLGGFTVHVLAIRLW